MALKESPLLQPLHTAFSSDQPLQHRESELYQCLLKSLDRLLGGYG